MRSTTRTLAATLAGLTGGLFLTGMAPVHATDSEPVVVWDQVGPAGNVVDDQGNPPGTGTGRYFPSMLTVRGHTYAVWSDNRVDDPYGQRNPEVMLRVSGDDGRTWGVLRNISADPVVGDDGPAALAANDSSVLVAFSTLTANAPTPYADATTLVRVTDNGDTVTRRRVDSPVLNPDLAGTGTNYYMVGQMPHSRDLSVSRSTDDGATFSAPTPVFTGCRTENANVAADDNTVAVAFINACSGTYGDVWATVSHDAGATWSTAANISAAPQQEYAPTVHIAGGVATIAWQTVRSQYGRTLDVATSADSGSTWSTPATVETHSTDQSSFGYDYSGPWTSPKFSGQGNKLTLYPPLSGNYLTSTDQGLSWSLAGTVPNNGQGIVYLNQGDHDLFAWQGQDTQAWMSTLVYRPAAPTNVTASADSNYAVVNWTAGPVSDRVDSYTVYDQTGRAVATVKPPVTTARIVGIVPGTTYTFTVRAHNAAGYSDDAVSVSVTAPIPQSAPARPSRPTATVKGHVVTVKWRAPNPHGSRITSYLVQAKPGATKKVSGSVYKAVFKRLKPGRYAFRVTAVNAVGKSPASAAVTVRVRR